MVEQKKCELCGDSITADRLSTDFVKDGIEASAHDYCLGELSSNFRRNMRVIE